MRSFLASYTDPRPIGAKEILKLRTAFEAELPELAGKASIDAAEIHSFDYLPDWHVAAVSWLKREARGRAGSTSA